MPEKPIIMTGESIPAILKRLKTQTRRVITPQPAPGSTLESYGTYACFSDGTRARCPYGPGPHAYGWRLWVREAWHAVANQETPNGWECVVGYEADGAKSKFIPTDNPLTRRTGSGNFRVRSPRFMPRWASRLTLEVVEVRVERLQEISYKDILAEGTKLTISDENTVHVYRKPDTYRLRFSQAWDLLNARRGFPFASNPWVWVVEFKLPEGEA